MLVRLDDWWNVGVEWIQDYSQASMMDVSSEDGFTNWDEHIQKEEEEKREEEGEGKEEKEV